MSEKEINVKKVKAEQDLLSWTVSVKYYELILLIQYIQTFKYRNEVKYGPCACT